MKPESSSKRREDDDEADCLSAFDDDVSTLVPAKVDPKAVQYHELTNGADGLVGEDAGAYELGLDGIGSDSLIGPDGSDSANAMRRHRHNVKEKERKEKIKLDMQEIQSLLPPSQVTDKRQTMHELLQLGIQRLRYLTEQNNQLAASGGGNGSELERLRKENEELKLESSRYRGLIASTGLPVDIDPSQLIVTWRYRTIEEINNPYLFAPGGQQMATGVLPTVSVDGSHQQMAQGMPQQFNGQVSYATGGDPATSQYMMYTDLLNSSDPSCLGFAANEQQNGFATHGTSLVTHNGQLMLVPQPQLQMQALSMTPCQTNQSADHLGTDQQTSNFETSNCETTIDRKQLDDVSIGGLESSGVCQTNETMECVGTDSGEAGMSEHSGATEDTVQVPTTDGVSCQVPVSVQDVLNSSERSPSVEAQSGNWEFFAADASTVQQTVTTNNTVIYHDGNNPTNTTYSPSGEHGAIGISTSAPCSIGTTNSDTDGQLQGNFGGQSVLLHNGQVLLVSQNQNMAPQSLGPSINGSVIGPDLGGRFCQSVNPQLSSTNLPLQSTPNSTNTVFLNKSNQFSSQSMTFFPGQSAGLPPALLQPPLPSNQTVTVNTPQGPMIMHTLPSKPNEHPQALILPDGQIVPVVTQPNLLFPPQQCIPVTGSLLVPSMTPSRLAPNVIQSVAQNTLAAKLVDVKGQAFALPQNPSMQLGGANLQPFSNIVPQVCSMAPLQAVPAQGHLPLPTHQPCPSVSKSLRSKKKQSVAVTTAAKASNLPQSFTAMVMPEGNILLLPGNEVPHAPPNSSHTKPSQRPLMPKPVPKSDGITAQSLMTVSQPPLVGSVPIATAQLAPVQVTSCAQHLTAPLMTPLTLSMPSQPILPFSCTQIPPVSANSTDILAQATESLFSISPNDPIQLTSDIFSKETGDDRLHIDIGSVGETDGNVRAENPWPTEKPKKSKKKKSTKARTVEEPMVDQQSMPLHLFSPGARHDDEKESDINDFADLIRMEPPTPAPPKGSEVSDGIATSAGCIAGVANDANSCVTANGLSVSSLESNVCGDSESLKSDNAESANMQSLRNTTTATSGMNCDSSFGLSSNDTVPLESANVKSPLGSPLKNSDCVKTTPMDICNTKRSKEESAVNGKKTSLRKKKSNKANENRQEESLILKTDKCQAHVTTSEVGHQSNDTELSVNTIESGSKECTGMNLGNAGVCIEKTPLSVERQRERAHGIVEEQVLLISPSDIDLVRTEKSHANSKDKKSRRSSKKEKTKTEVSTEEDNFQDRIAGGSGIESDLREATDSDNQKGFALSNFLPTVCKPNDAAKSADVRSSEGHKKSQQLNASNIDMSEPPKPETETVWTTEEATQTVRKELRSRHHDDHDSDHGSRKRQKKKKTPVEQVSEELPETLTFGESEIFDVIDRVENMAAATQTEPKRKSHGRKHKSSCERDGDSSSKRRKKNHKAVELAASLLEKPLLAADVSAVDDVKATDTVPPDQAGASSKPNPIDIFNFEVEDNSGIIENQAVPCKLMNKKQDKVNASDKDRKNVGELDSLKRIEKPISPKPGLVCGANGASFTSASSVSRSKFSFFASSDGGTLSGIERLSSSNLEISKSDSSEVSQPKTSGDSLFGTIKSAESSFSLAASSAPDVVSYNSSSSAKQGIACIWSGSPAARDVSSSAVDVPYSKASEIPTSSAASSISSNVLSGFDAGKVSAGKARHSNIVSLTGSLTPKSAVTKLTSHSQRTKIERDAAKDAANTREPEKNLKLTKNYENESHLETPVSSSLFSAEIRHRASTGDVSAKETVSVETTDDQHRLKLDKERTHQAKEPIASSAENCTNDGIGQNSLPTSSADHYAPSTSVLPQCAYNETHKKSCSQSSVINHGTASVEATVTMPSTRSVSDQKSNSAKASSQNGSQPKAASSFNSTGSGLEMERKSWHDEIRRRNDADYYASLLSSTVPSCAVQNKNSAPYSCSSVFPTDKIGMAAHQQPETGNFSGGFGGLAQNSFYPQPSSYRGLDELSPCGGDGMPRGSMSSCSVDKHSSTAKTVNPSNDSGLLRRDLAKTNQHENYFTPQFLEPTVSPVLNSMNRDKSSCLRASLSSQTNSRQPLPNSSSMTAGSRSHAHSPSIAEQQSSYSALSAYHGASGSLATSMLHHHSSSDYGRYSNNGPHSFGFDMFQTPGSQFNPNLAGLTFDPPPLNVFRDCSSVSMQSSGVKKSASKLPDSGGFETSKSMTSSRVASQPTSNQSQSCKTGSNRSTSKSSSSSSTKKSAKPSASYGMESGMLDSRCVTPFIGLGSLSPPRSTMPPESLSYFAPPNLFGNAGRTLPSAKTLQHRDTPLPLNAALFSPSRAAQNGFGLNFQTGFAMDHVHGSHMGSSQMIAPPPSANAMSAHMHGFGFGNIFPDISGAAQRDHLSMSPIKIAGGMDAGSLHHHHHQGAGSMYNGRGQLPAHMLSDMGFNPFFGAQHPGFDARGIATPFGSLWT